MTRKYSCKHPKKQKQENEYHSNEMVDVSGKHKNVCSTLCQDLKDTYMNEHMFQCNSGWIEEA